jgi:hypothetical protein
MFQRAAPNRDSAPGATFSVATFRFVIAVKPVPLADLKFQIYNINVRKRLSNASGFSVARLTQVSPSVTFVCKILDSIATRKL